MSDERIDESHHVWLREAARDLRRRSMLTEQRLWAVLRARRVDGRRFRRQHPIGPYIVDFLCFEARVVVEIDGAVHAFQREYDAERDDYLERLGYRIVRISAKRISRDRPGVLDQIQTACQAPPLPRATRGSRAAEDVGAADVRAAQRPRAGG
jgi:very-short-patch-repair endonuclease